HRTVEIASRAGQKRAPDRHRPGNAGRGISFEFTGLEGKTRGEIRAFFLLWSKPQGAAVSRLPFTTIAPKAPFIPGYLSIPGSKICLLNSRGENSKQRFPIAA